DSDSGKRNIRRTTVRIFAHRREAALFQHLEYPLSALRRVTDLEVNLTHFGPAKRARRPRNDVFRRTGRVNLDVVGARDAVILHEFVNRQHDSRLAAFMWFVTLAAETERAGGTELRDLEPGDRALSADSDQQAINPVLQLVGFAIGGEQVVIHRGRLEGDNPGVGRQR